MRSFLCLLLILSLLSFLLCSCFSPTAPSNALLQMCNAEPNLPSGKYYFYGSSPSSSGTMIDSALFCEHFGFTVLPPAMSEVESGAFYFSYRHPCEFAVLRCKSISATTAIAQILLRHIEQLRSYWNSTEYAPYVNAAEVKIFGKDVVFAVSKNPSSSFNAYKRG